MNYSRCIESVGYAHVLSVTLYFVAVYSRGFEASNLEHVSRLMLLTIVASCAFLFILWKRKTVLEIPIIQETSRAFFMGTRF